MTPDTDILTPGAMPVLRWRPPQERATHLVCRLQNHCPSNLSQLSRRPHRPNILTGSHFDHRDQITSVNLCASVIVGSTSWFSALAVHQLQGVLGMSTSRSRRSASLLRLLRPGALQKQTELGSLIINLSEQGHHMDCHKPPIKAKPTGR